eukprot:gnl/TRDRNA2_/TRDRNA2_174551_c0_seq2.p1 gnl/TRDRNA2_/TRDRNA2_174551_c0~~gnl/TRDRNA2_/TRDRNA2_174551_c0_seq2.p1  ORF type:complete len:122 (-),score=11.38 gnl/TRDRNA2_/TRDRNA2_174551_c0_seq2:137-502(-)
MNRSDWRRPAMLPVVPLSLLLQLVVSDIVPVYGQFVCSGELALSAACTGSDTDEMSLLRTVEPMEAIELLWAPNSTVQPALYSCHCSYPNPCTCSSKQGSATQHDESAAQQLASQLAKLAR